ncbi:hypothetical protein HJC23_010606 [Cyclotella cryptica]|uniref:uridine/cytidine kinase n=1 Tax=Cyclotella cryptica TaxID=29204 RepID=A0ABD3PRQ2_9STRA|eukprot:CCRYP_012799-RB/>CCRYP_012799-RB protein AED:0.41 eAED:0.41 QI:226/1/1/1/0.5/0.33/3/1263/246
MAPSKPIVVGIAGGTGAGKTTFARSIYAAFGGTRWGVRNRENTASDLSTEDECHITYLSHDDYYKDLSHLPFESRSCTNFDHPSSLDTDLMIQHISDLLEGKSVVVPRYDFSRHCRYQEGEIDNEGRCTGRVVESKKIILVEGILILSIRELVNMMDLKVYVDASPDIRLLRRIQRDTLERSRSIADIVAQYSATVRPMHNEFVEPSKQNADLIVHGHDEDEVVSRDRMDLAMRVICNHLKLEAGL